MPRFNQFAPDMKLVLSKLLHFQGIKLSKNPKVPETVEVAEYHKFRSALAKSKQNRDKIQKISEKWPTIFP